MSVINTHNFGRFWSISCTITQCFRVPKRFPRLTILRVRLRVHRQHSQYWPILTRFMDHYSPFWGPKAISMTDDPRGAFTCPSSAITVLANSDPFHGLLLTVLGPEAISIVVEPQGALTCRSSTLTILADSGPFRALLICVLGSQSDFLD